MRKKIGIVTGATGGIGKEYVNCLLNESLDEIWAVARNVERLEKLKNELDGKITAISADLSDSSSYELIRDKLAAEKPEVKFLINNAGAGNLGCSSDFSDDYIKSDIATHCAATAILCNACLPYMKKGSRIINMASLASFQPLPYINLYAANKAFVRSYTRSLNTELKSGGISATAVCPGWVRTGLLPDELNGHKVKFFAITTADAVAAKALKDAKEGRDMSVYGLPVKLIHLLVKLLPQRVVMSVWRQMVKKYL